MYLKEWLYCEYIIIIMLFWWMTLMSFKILEDMELYITDEWLVSQNCYILALKLTLEIFFFQLTLKELKLQGMLWPNTQYSWEIYSWNQCLFIPSPAQFPFNHNQSISKNK